MKVSIITACINNADTIEDTINCIQSQDYGNIEYIVVDGGSTDGTLDILKNYRGQIAKCLSEIDNGLYDALNKGVRLATGDLIGFVHADDLLANGSVISRVVECFTSSGADAIYGDLLYVSKDHSDKVIRHWQSGEYNQAKLRFGWMPPHPTLYLKRKIYEKAKLPNGEYFDTSFTCAADYDFMMRLLGKMQISIAYLQQVFVKMRVGGISNKNLKHILRKSREDLIAMQRNNIGGIRTLLAKNIRKLPQFIHR